MTTYKDLLSTYFPGKRMPDGRTIESTGVGGGTHGGVNRPNITINYTDGTKETKYA